MGTADSAPDLHLTGKHVVIIDSGRQMINANASAFAAQLGVIDQWVSGNSCNDDDVGIVVAVGVVTSASETKQSVAVRLVPSGKVVLLGHNREWPSVKENAPPPEPVVASAGQPSVQSGVSPPLSVDGWLAQIQLAEYAPPIKQYGYDKLEFLLHASEAEIEEEEAEILEMTDAVAMKKPHSKTMLVQWRELIATNAGPVDGGCAAAPGSPPASVQFLDKYIATEKQIRLGRPEDATHGLQCLLGLSDAALGAILADPVGAMRREFEFYGDAEDKANFDKVFSGSWGDGKTLEAIMSHPNAVMAKLKLHHVLALRLYTTTSFAKVNDPLRADPPPRPHPFAATTHFIDQGIKLLRAVAASLPDAHQLRVYWRGMKDIGLSTQFMAKGGTEFGCLSTSASQEVAVSFALSALPLVFKFETKDFTSRGADIAFLSVYPKEEEALYPPLTYLRSVKMENETLAGVEVLVATVEPVFM